MAKYNGTYACGHQGVVDVRGKYSERQYWIDREFKGLCKMCLEEKRCQEISEKNKKSTEKAIELGLPELKGSSKQIAWATSIRQEFVDDWIKIKVEINDEDTFAKAEQIYNRIIEQLESKFWIDNEPACSNATYLINCVHLGEVVLLEDK